MRVACGDEDAFQAVSTPWAGHALRLPDDVQLGLRTRSGTQLHAKREQGTLAHTVFEQLDYIYEPSPDVATDIVYFEKVLGGRIVFAVEGMGARVAMVQLTEGPPHILLTDHLGGDRPIFIYRVDDLDHALAQLESRGWSPEGRLEIPMGPCCSFTTPGGHRIALYQMARPEVARHFEGRRDF